MNGIGTLIYSWVTKSGIPAYLGSSFAFIAPVMLVISSYGGFSHAQSGFIFFGLFFIAISIVVKKWGIRWIDGKRCLVRIVFFLPLIHGRKCFYNPGH
jgi:uracil permease